MWLGTWTSPGFHKIAILLRYWQYPRPAAAQYKGPVPGQSIMKTELDIHLYALKHENWQVRRGAIVMLEKLGEPAIEHLIAVLRDQQSEVRARAASALEKITGQKFAHAGDWEKWLKKQK